MQPNQHNHHNYSGSRQRSDAFDDETNYFQDLLNERSEILDKIRKLQREDMSTMSEVDQMEHEHEVTLLLEDLQLIDLKIDEL